MKITASMMNLTAALSEILLLSASAWLIISASKQPPLSELAIGITLVRTAGISRAVLRYADRYFSHKTIFEMSDNLREKIFIEVAKKIPQKTGKILHDLLVEADEQKNFLPRVILPLTTAFLIGIILSVLLENFLPIAIFFLNVILAKIFSEGAADDTKYRENILDLYEGREELKIFGESPAIKKLNLSAKNFAKAEEKFFNRRENFLTFTRLINLLGIYLILQNLTIGSLEFGVWIFILLAVFEINCAVSNAVLEYKKISAKNFLESAEEKNLIGENNFAVELKNVSFSYAKKIVLENFNLQVKVGEQIAIVGESGAGKTTLLYLMTQNFFADGGEIFLRGKVCAATHDNYIFSQSIRKNFEIYCGEIAEEKILEILEISQLKNFSLDEEIGEDGNFLSGGERVRLQIALAIGKDADTLILDEPTAGLDRVRGENLIAAVKNFCTKKNRTLIVITHDENISKKFSRIICLPRFCSR